MRECFGSHNKLNTDTNKLLLPMDNYEYYIASIEEILKENQKGMTVSELALDLHMSRNTVGKYLELMYLSGVVDVRSVGKAKLYYLAPRVPVTRVLSYLSDAVIQTDDRYRIVNINLSALDLLGADEEDLIGRNLLDLLGIQGLNSEMRARITNPDRDVAFTDEIHFHSDTKPRNLWMTVADMVMYDGVLGHTFILEDITDWKEAEQKRRVSDFLFSTLAEETWEQVFIFSPDFAIQYANPRYTASDGRGDDLAGLNLLEPYDKQASQIIRDSVEIVTETSAPHRQVFPVMVDQQIPRWLDQRLYPIPDQSGKVEQILGITRDITGLQEGGSASALLSVLLTSMAEGVLTVTLQGTILSWNQGAETITGYPAEELLGGNAHTIIPPELNGELNVIADAVRGRTVRDIRYTIRAKGGRKKKVILSSATVQDHTGEISMIVLIWREP